MTISTHPSLQSCSTEMIEEQDTPGVNNMGMNDLEHETHDRLVNLQTRIKNMSGDIVLVGDIMLDLSLIHI